MGTLRPLTDDGLYDLLDALGFDTSHRALEKRSLGLYVALLERRLEEYEEAMDALDAQVRSTLRANEILRQENEEWRRAAADARP